MPKGEKRKSTEFTNEPTPYEIVKRKSSPGSIIHTLSDPEDSEFQTLLICISSHETVVPEAVLTRLLLLNYKNTTILNYFDFF